MGTCCGLAPVNLKKTVLDMLGLCAGLVGHFYCVGADPRKVWTCLEKLRGMLIIPVDP